MMTKRLVTAALAALILATVPGAALAQEVTTTERTQQQPDVERAGRWVEAVKERALEAIDKRLDTIDDLEGAIERSDTVHPGHAGQLAGDLRSSAAGLESLAAKIERTDDLATLRTLVPKIFEDYRIYAVVAPKVHLVLTADAAGAVAELLEGATSTLGTALDRLAEHGIDVGDAESLLAEMERLVASGGEAADAVPDMVLGLTPADYPGSSETLRAAHSELRDAGDDLRMAGQNAHEIVRFIVSVIGTDA